MMKLDALNFSGHFEEERREVGETFQLAAPDDELDESLISWAMLRHGETVVDADSVRRITSSATGWPSTSAAGRSACG